MIQCHLSQLYVCNRDTALTLIQDIPAMQRRRLSALAKLALHTARLALQDYPTVDYMVWSSRYGDEQRTQTILQDIVQQHTPSPTQFSTSVHNAIAGLYSILFQDQTPSISLSSDAQHTVQDTVLEAYAYLTSHQKKQALIVYYDEPLPEIYQDIAPVTQPIAVAFCLSLAQPNFKLSQTDMMAVEHHQIEQSQIEDFVHFYQSEQTMWQSKQWVWQKC